MRKLIFALLATMLIGGFSMVSAQDAGGRIALTVYNAGTALIQDQRAMTLAAGINSVTVRDVAATIDPTSFRFMSLSDNAGAVVLEQSYRYDEGDAAALLGEYIGETVDLHVSSDERYSGELLRLQDEKAVLRTAAHEIVFVKTYDIRAIQFPSPPADLYAGPTLQLLLNSDSAGAQDVELSYLAGGMNWTADYGVFLNADENAFDLAGMVTLSNRSGAAYDYAALKLIAGAVSRIELQEDDYAEERMMALSAMADESATVEQRDLSEFKLYAIARRSR